MTAKTPRSRSKAMPERKRCPGSGHTIQDLYGNPSACCPVCGKHLSLTKRGKAPYHKRVPPPPPKPQPLSLQEQHDGLQVCYQAAQADRDFFRKECFSLQEQLQDALTEIDNLMMQIVVKEFNDA